MKPWLELASRKASSGGEVSKGNMHLPRVLSQHHPGTVAMGHGSTEAVPRLGVAPATLTVPGLATLERWGLAGGKASPCPASTIPKPLKNSLNLICG